MEKIILANQIKSQLKNVKKLRKIIVLVGGCFDIIHIGHINFLRKAKEKGDFLVVLLESDKTVAKIKGNNRPINTQNERAQVLSSLKEVDLIVKLAPSLSNEDYYTLVKIIKPDIIACTKNDPIKNIKTDQAKIVGAEIFEVRKTEGHSTSKIIGKIKKNTD